MLTKEQYEIVRARTLEFFDRAHIALTDEERNSIEVADYGFGYDSLFSTGLELITYVNNDRYCAKELICFPGQISPEHIHPPVHGKDGKRETFRCRWGVAYLYIQGEPTADPFIKPSDLPKGKEAWYTVWHEIKLLPGDQYTLEPGTKHWFTGGKEGAVISEFSSPSFDELDIFTDPNIIRIPKIAD